MCYAALEDYLRALADADKAIMLRPTSALAHYHRGIALQGLGRLEAAKQALEHAASNSLGQQRGLKENSDGEELKHSEPETETVIYDDAELDDEDER